MRELVSELSWAHAPCPTPLSFTSATSARGSPPSTFPACLKDSTGSIRRAPANPAEPGSAWPSPSMSCLRTPQDPGRKRTEPRFHVLVPPALGACHNQRLDRKLGSSGMPIAPDVVRTSIEDRSIELTIL